MKKDKWINIFFGKIHCYFFGHYCNWFDYEHYMFTEGAQVQCSYCKKWLPEPPEDAP